MFTKKIAVAATLSALTCTVVSTAASAAEGTAYPKRVDLVSAMTFSWDPATSTTVVTFSTGCRSTMAGAPANDLHVSLDREHRRFQLDGNFFVVRHKLRTSRIRTADCMASRTERFAVTDIAPGSYEIVRNGKSMWTLDLGSEPLKRHKGGIIILKARKRLREFTRGRVRSHTVVIEKSKRYVLPPDQPECRKKLPICLY